MTIEKSNATVFSFENGNILQACFYTLLALIVWLPIPLGSNRPWAWSIMEFVSFVILAVVVARMPAKTFAEQLKTYWPLALGMLLFLLYQVLQLVPLPVNVVQALSPNTVLVQNHGSLHSDWLSIAVDPNQAMIATLKACSYFAIMLSVLLLVTDFKRLKLLLVAIVIACTWQAFYGSIMALSGQEQSFFWSMNNSSTANGSFVYRNHFANFLIMGLAIGLGYLVATLDKNSEDKESRKDKATRWLTSMVSGKAALRVALAIMVIALVLSRSRMGNTAFFAALTVTGILAFFLLRHKSKSLGFLLISVLIIDTFILGAYFGIDKVKTRIEQTSISSEARVDFNQYSWQLVKLFPRVGTGGGGYYTVFPLVQGDDINAFLDHAHNDYLQFAIEYGIPATLWLGIVVLVSLGQGVVAMRRRRSKLLQGVGFATTLAIIGMLLHISVDFNLQAPANAAYFHIVLALAWIANNGLKSKNSLKPNRNVL
ncbi:O-antigen ligase family protein [Thalassotalea sp. HSM 43]|uniref:O-antigen ligase family protein n=1 Tax=Thalassotalea sp. HSM 43 TaxID=2552945 RepID=UPI001081D21D|nr:O-antigen ligase family protein [Thalassotalea sp. HSM 43]QBY03150.1 O-antigen ligase family protein [Thalassotalea sp. HSM 43]